MALETPFSDELGDATLGGQRILREVLGQYHEASFEPEMKRKAELILLTNYLIG